MMALQNLNRTNSELQTSQMRINTGLKVANAKDNGAVYNIAQQMRSEKSALEAVRTGLDRAKSIADVAMAAGEALSDVFVQMRDKAVAASDPSISTTSRAAFNQEFQQLRDQVLSIINNAVFDGANILGGGANLTFQANTTGSQLLTLPTLDLRLPAAPAPIATPAVAIYLGSGADLTSQANAADARDRVTASLTFVNSELARLGAAAKRVESHSIFVGKLQDSITGGIGNMVDADLATESARLQSLQVKQQLGTQALSIANQAPQSILSLFRN
jgi:flagellin